MASKHALTFRPGVLLKSIGSRSSSQEYRNKQPIFSQGDAADAMFYVETGNVKLTVLSKGGKKAVIAIFRQGDFFGEGCLGTPQPLRMSTATAVQVTMIVRVEKATIGRLIHDDPVFARMFIAHLLVSCRPNRRRSPRSTLQLQREATGANAPLTLELWNTIQATSSHLEGEPGNLGRDDWHYSVESKLFYEPFSQVGPHRLQRQLAGAQRTAHITSSQISGTPKSAYCLIRLSLTPLQWSCAILTIFMNGIRAT